MLKYILESLDEADGVEAHYKEGDDGKYYLDLEGGPKDLSGDVDRLSRSLNAERDAHKTTKQKYGWAQDLTPEEVQRLKDAEEDLKYQLENNQAPTQEEIQERAEQLAARQTRSLENELNQTRENLTNYQQAVQLHEAAANQRRIKDAVEEALATGKVKVHDSAREDIVPYAERIMEITEDGRVVSKEGVGVDPGMSFNEVLQDLNISGRREHWFVKSEGAGMTGGSGGSGGYSGVNPFDKDGGTWNLSRATKMAKDDPKLALSLCKKAGQNPKVFGLTDA